MKNFLAVRNSTGIPIHQNRFEALDRPAGRLDGKQFSNVYLIGPEPGLDSLVDQTLASDVIPRFYIAVREAQLETSAEALAFIYSTGALVGLIALGLCLCRATKVCTGAAEVQPGPAHVEMVGAQQIEEMPGSEGRIDVSVSGVGSELDEVEGQVRGPQDLPQAYAGVPGEVIEDDEQPGLIAFQRRDLHAQALDLD